MRICLIATEFPGMGPYGGFGVLTYDIAAGLAKKGLEVYVTMPRKDGQKPVEMVDGITVLSYPSSLYVGVREVLPYAGLYRAINADIYHSQEPSVGTALAQVAEPNKKHIVTFQDPRDREDWRIELAHRPPGKVGEWRFWFAYQRGVGKAARNADAAYCQAKYIISKVARMYRLPKKPAFLPNPVRMPEIRSRKNQTPTVCFVGRWDERKRPELFFDLAARFPEVKFVAGGACKNNPDRDNELRQRCRQLKNVEAPGWLNEYDRADLLDKAWILINTSTRECLPVSYLEAGSHKCAILSHCNADDFAGSFGFWAKKGDLDDFTQGLNFLLENDRWKSSGEKAFDYVRNIHEYDRVIDQHIQVYRQILSF